MMCLETYSLLKGLGNSRFVTEYVQFATFKYKTIDLAKFDIGCALSRFKPASSYLDMFDSIFKIMEI